MAAVAAGVCAAIARALVDRDSVLDVLTSTEALACQARPDTATRSTLVHRCLLLRVDIRDRTVTWRFYAAPAHGADRRAPSAVKVDRAPSIRG
jgi:hypothetical protein